MMLPAMVVMSLSLCAAPDAAPIEHLQALHLKEAGRWEMFVDKEQRTKAEMNEQPIYAWTNPTRAHGQHGVLLVWTHRGRPVCIGSTFSHPEKEMRMLCHEFHSLWDGTLAPRRDGEGETWQPTAAVKMSPLPGGPLPAASKARRLLQMRALARRFDGHSIDFREERWELRLLPQPLYRYAAPDDGVIDGALFALVTSAGTDPEVIIALEARGDEEEADWHYRAVRFSDSSLYVTLDAKDVWSSVRDERNQLHFNPDHTYRLIRDRYLEEAELPVSDKGSKNE